MTPIDIVNKTVEATISALKDTLGGKINPNVEQQIKNRVVQSMQNLLGNKTKTEKSKPVEEIPTEPIRESYVGDNKKPVLSGQSGNVANPVSRPAR